MRSVRQIEEEIAAKTREVNPLAVRYVEGGLEGDDLAAFRRLKGELEALAGERADADRSETERRADLEAAQRAIDAHRHNTTPAGGSAARQAPRDGAGNPTEGSPERGRSMGEQFVRSQQFAEYRQHGVGRGANSGRVNVDYGPSAQRALITSTVVTELIDPQRMPGVLGPDPRELTLRAALPNGRTGSNLIEFVREASRTNNAAEVAEATNLSTGLKPESGFALESAAAPVRTIATLMYVTRAALDDTAGLQSMIDGMLRSFIDERIDRQLLIGDGVAPNLEGINEVSGVLALDEAYYDGLAAPLTSAADRIRHAYTRIRIASRGRADLVVLNPADLEALELLRTNADAGNNEYAMAGGGPFGGGVGPRTIWGRPIIEHENQTAGQATVLDRRACMVMDRMDTQVFISDSNRDLFERNILTILAETRLAFPIFFPSRIALVDITATV